ncbi:MAG TPA: hypothetical protein VGX51_11180 [Solirubrobacteraceae bacterium]|jgi:hypothetical protein|nr:hypothetical protein [Solirubrobacteraceae bacterium]
MASDLADEVLTEWERQRGAEFAAHFKAGFDYLAGTVRELASADAAWTITPHAGHPVLLLAGDTAFALLAFSGPPDGITISGALHPLDEGVIRVSFNDRPTAADVELEGARPIRPLVRQWAFDWHGRLQLPIEYWLPFPKRQEDGPGAEKTLQHHERQRAMAHKLARAAGWPMP